MDFFQPYLMMLITSLNKNDSTSYMSIFLVVIIPLITRFMNSKDFSDICKKITIFFKEEWITINIPTHEVDLLKSFCKTKGTKQIHSDHFLAICHYLKYSDIPNIKSLTELLTFETELQKYNNNEDSYNEHRHEEKNKYIFIPYDTEKIKICSKRNIYCEITNMSNDNEEENKDDKTKIKYSQKKKYVMTLMIQKNPNSTKDQMSILKTFLEECLTQYYLSIKPKEENKFLFEFRCAEKYDYSTILYWDEHNFETNKDLNTNIFFDDKEDYLNYVRQFKYNPDKEYNDAEETYKRAGFVYKSGILFYGSPGCGKTSVIKGTLKETNRHGIIVDLSRVDSASVLKKILNGRKFNNKTFKSRELCYIFEDCDAIKFDIIKKRQTAAEEIANSLAQNEKTELSIVQQLLKTSPLDQNSTDDINLSQLLQLLDGVNESPGIMYIFTTNHPEKIDDALLRPGRIDYIYEFKKCSRQMIEDIVKTKFNISKKIRISELENIKEFTLSPAEVQGICFKNNDLGTCLNKIIINSNKS